MSLRTAEFMVSDTVFRSPWKHTNVKTMSPRHTGHEGESLTSKQQFMEQRENLKLLLVDVVDSIEHVPLSIERF